MRGGLPWWLDPHRERGETAARMRNLVKGGGERDYNGFHILLVDATVEPEIESSTILQMDKLGRKFFLCLSMVLSGAAAFLIYLITSSTIYLVISCVFGAVSTMGFNSLDCLSEICAGYLLS